MLGLKCLCFGEEPRHPPPPPTSGRWARAVLGGAVLVPGPPQRGSGVGDPALCGPCCGTTPAAGRPGLGPSAALEFEA